MFDSVIEIQFVRDSKSASKQYDATSTVDPMSLGSIMRDMPIVLENTYVVAGDLYISAGGDLYRDVPMLYPYD